jgi:3-phosphoshikimate 1-carboxyvinyltransferase
MARGVVELDLMFEKSHLMGEVSAPASKSYVQRIVACAALAKGDTVMRGYTECDDSQKALKAVESMGATVFERNGAMVLRVEALSDDPHVLDFGGSATSMRIFTGVSCVTPGLKKLTGSAQLLRRPMSYLVDSLRELGAKIEYLGNNSPPLLVHPTGLRGGSTVLDASVSSQFTSSIMICSVKAREGVRISHVGPLVSTGYIRMTARVLEMFGSTPKLSADLREIHIEPCELRPVEVDVEGDYSSAAYILAAGAINGEVLVRNLNPYSLQPDKIFLEHLKHMGAKVEPSDKGFRVSSSMLDASEFDLQESPDLAPILGVLAAYSNGTSVLKGLERLKYKESDRVSTTLEMLRSLGVDATYLEGQIRIKGGCVAGGTVDSHGDHRIALAAAVAATGSQGPVRVTGFECFRKSYPQFLEHYTNLGGRVQQS